MVFLVLHCLPRKKGTKANKFERGACDYPFSLSFPHCFKLLQLAVFQTKFKRAQKCSLQGLLPKETANVQMPPAQLLRSSLVSPDTLQGRQCMPTCTLQLMCKNPPPEYTQSQSSICPQDNAGTHHEAER